jgi:hypothetical protein
MKGETKKNETRWNCKCFLLATLCTGCATGLSSVQEREYKAMKAENVLVEEKNPGTGAVLGILPGGGSFYAREPGFGVVNLLFWPLSILWDPVSGYEGAKAINYDVTKQQLKKKKETEISALDDKLRTGELSNTDYVSQKQKVDKKYDFE